MGEKIKDLIYDFSDIIISLVIITMIFGVVSWKISDSMAYTQFTGQASKAVLSTEKTDASDSESTEETNVTTTTDTAANTTTAPAATTPTGGKPSASASTASTGSNTATTATTPPASTTPAVTAAVSADVKIVIPAGSAGITIAKILKEQGVISDTKIFITRVDELKMGPKLKAGTFTIKAGSSLDDVINIIAGKK